MVACTTKVPIARGFFVFRRGKREKNLNFRINMDSCDFVGKPVPYAEVDIEYNNKDKKVVAPTDYKVTQTIKADQNGVFAYAAPKAGWWGFAALNEADFKIKKDGQDKGVEIGTELWVHFEPWQQK
jgi:uncharacterized GH25 family protein